MLQERTKLFLRLRFEQAIHGVFTDTFNKDGLEYALFLLKESPVLLSNFIDKYGGEFERILLSEQEGDGN